MPKTVTSEPSTSQSPNLQVNASNDPGMPRELGAYGIIVGPILAIGGIAVMAFLGQQFRQIGTLMTCVGFGIVLAALGARAAGTWRSWSVTGSGAIAIILFVLLEHYTPTMTTPLFVRGNLHGTNELTSVRMFAAQSLLVGRPSSGEHFRFVAFQEDVKSPAFYINFVNERSSDLKEFYIGCISTELIQPRAGQSEWLNLSLERDLVKNVWRLKDNADRREYGEWGALHDCATSGSTSSRQLNVSELGLGAVVDWLPKFSWNLAGSAFAEVAAIPTVQSLLAALEADSTEARGTARDELSKRRDTASYQEMAVSWHVAQSSYRADLGRLVAWVSGIRANREAAALLTAVLSADQFGYIVHLTGHPDKTIRFYATESVSWMLQSTGWPDGTKGEQARLLVNEVSKIFHGPEVVDVSKQGIMFDFGNMSFNTLIALDNAKCVLAPALRGPLADALANAERGYLQQAAAQKTIQLAQLVRQALDKGCTNGIGHSQ